MEDIITIVGPRGVGKSTTGKELARITNYEYIDFDRIIEQELKSEGGIFAYAQKYGWPAFNKMFHYSLKGFLPKIQGRKVILDIGGATISSPVFPESKLNAKLLRGTSKVFLILPDVDKEKAIQALIDRELKRGVPYAVGWPIEKIKEKIASDYLQSLPYFIKRAHHHIYAQNQSPQEVARLIADEMSK